MFQVNLLTIPIWRKQLLNSIMGHTLGHDKFMDACSEQIKMI